MKNRLTQIMTILTMIVVAALAMTALASNSPNSEKMNKNFDKNTNLIVVTSETHGPGANIAPGNGLNIVNPQTTASADQLKIAVINKSLHQMEPQTVGTSPDTVATANYNYEKTPTVGGTSPESQKNINPLYESSIAFYGNSRTITAGVQRR